MSGNGGEPHVELFRLGPRLFQRPTLAAVLITLLVFAPSAGGGTAYQRCHPGALSVDVTGDGVRDAVGLHGRWTQDGCRYWLSVRTSGVARSTRLREGLLEAPNVSPMVRIASLSAAARIDARPGAEILVVLNRAASGEGVAAYTFRDGALRYMPIEGQSRVDGLFWHIVGGLAGSRADCWRRSGSGRVVTLSYQVDPSGRGADLSRAIWRVERSAFRLQSSRHYRKTHRQFPEQTSRAAFWRCSMRG